MLKLTEMKKFIFIFITAIFLSLCATLVCNNTIGVSVQASTTSSLSSLSQQYLATKKTLDGSFMYAPENLHENTFTIGAINKVSISETAKTNLITNLSINVLDWTNIKSFTIKKIILNKVFTVHTDDRGENCFFDDETEIPDSSSEFLFAQDGAYLVELTYNNNSNTENHGIYTSSAFSRNVNISSLQITENGKNGGQILSSVQSSNDLTNLILPSSLKFGTKTIIQINANPELYNSSLYSIELSNSLITQNETTYLTIKNIDKTITFHQIKLDVFVDIPELKFKNAEETEVSDILSSIIGLTYGDSILFFNEQVTPYLSFDAKYNDDAISNFNSIFTFDYAQTEIGFSTITAKLNIVQNDQIVTPIFQHYQIDLDPNNLFELKIASQDGPTYISENYLNGVYVVANIFAESLTENLVKQYFLNSRNEIVDNQTSANKCIIVIVPQSEQQQPIHVFCLDYVQYRESTQTKIEITQVDNVISIKNGNFSTLPVDLYIINENTNDMFEIQDIFAGLTTNLMQLEINNPGSYRIIAKYRGMPLDINSNTWNHAMSMVNIQGTSITITQNSLPIRDNQIINDEVTVTANKPYIIIKNNKQIGEYSANQITQLKDSGYYVVISGEQLRTFSIISTLNSLTNYSVSSTNNITPKQITLDDSIIKITNPYTLLSISGTYTITNDLISQLTLKINGESITLYSSAEFTYQVKIEPINFNITTNIKNGERTSKNIIIENINALGNWTLYINYNGKITEYTKSEFNLLTKSQKTLTKNGTYTITIQDENGNQFEYSFIKYYSISTGLIILIIVLSILAIVGIALIIKLRLKSKVR